MAVEWVAVGTDVVVGGGLGAVDQLVQNADEKRETVTGAKLPIMAQYGTYYNYGVPLATLAGAAFGFIKGDWITRLVSASSVLAGRKVTHQVTKRGPVTYLAWRRDKELEDQRNRQLAQAKKQSALAPVGVGIEF